MQLRLIRPALKYFSSFATNVCRTDIHALEYLARATQQEGEREYWLIDGIHCRGKAIICFQAKGRKAAIATHIELTNGNASAELALIRLAVRKAWKLGISPVVMACEATDFFRRKQMERAGGELVGVVRERTPRHRGKLRVYSFASPVTAAAQGILGNAGQLSEDLARRTEVEPLTRTTVE
jgi:hypothetical protein